MFEEKTAGTEYRMDGIPYGRWGVRGDSAMRRLACIGILTGCVIALAVSGAYSEEEQPAEPKARGGRHRGQLTDEQLQQLKDRFAQRQAERAGQGGTGGAAGLDPKKANLTLVAEAFKAGEAAFKAENYPGAFEYLVDVAACAHIQGAANFSNQARGRILEMEKMAADKLEEARLKKLQGDGPGALEVLKILREKFYFTKVADEAGNLLQALASDPRVAASVDMMAAEESDGAGRYAEAAGRYESVMKKYPESVQALKAKLRLEAMRKDEAIAAAIKEGVDKSAESTCPGILAMARNFVANGRQDKARPLFQKVVDGFPESEYAKEAQKALDEMDAGARKKESVEPPETQE